MKRKYLSALLMGTLAVASTSTFTSCKDYDSDISNLQQQIDKLATADQLSAKVTELQSLINTNKTDIASLKKDLDDCTTLDEVQELFGDYASKDYVNTATQTLSDAIAALKSEDIAQLKADIVAAQEAAKKTTDSLAIANAEIVETLNNYATKSEVSQAKEAANIAIAAIEAKDSVALATAKAEILAKLQDYATQSELQTVANNAANALAAAKKEQAAVDSAQQANASNEWKAAKKKLDDAIKAAQDTADAAKSAAATNAASIAALATTTQTANEALTKAKANETAITNALNLLGDGFSKDNTVAAAIAAIKAQIGTPDAKLGTLDSRLASIEATLKGVEGDDTKLGLSTKITNIENSLKSIIGEYTTMVTEVSLVGCIDDNSVFNKNLGLTFKSADIANDLTFGKGQKDNTGKEVKEASNQQKYVKGTSFNNEATIAIRVNPTNAQITKDMIKLVDSQGNDLNNILEVTSVQPLNSVLSRATEANKTGLWTVTLKVKNDVATNKIEQKVEVNGVIKHKLYAVAIKNTDTAKDAQDRYVTSSYDVTVEKPTKFEAAENLDNVKIYSEETMTAANAITLKAAMKYAADKDGVVVTAKNKENIVLDFSKYKGQIEYFYVVRDDNHVDSETSGSSAINAWNSYGYTGLGQVVKADENGKISIDVKDGQVGDKIGFRIFAVNYNGVLAPVSGGDSFVVYVGADKAKVSATGNLEATETKNRMESGWIKLDGALVDDANTETAVKVNNGHVTMTTANGKVIDVHYDLSTDGKTAATTGTALSKCKYIKFYVDNSKTQSVEWADDNDFTKDKLTDGYTLQLWEDGTTATGYLHNTKPEAATNLYTNNIKVTLTKEMPTVASTKEKIKYSWKANQKDANNVYTAYLYNTNQNKWEIKYGPAATSDGFKNVNQAINNLSGNWEYVVENASLVEDTKTAKKYYTGDLVADNGNSFVLDVCAYKDDNGTELIDNKTAHASHIRYNYGTISSKSTGDYSVTVEDFSTVFACPLAASANTVSWKSGATTSATYGATDATIDTDKANVVNAFDSNEFGNTLTNLLNHAAVESISSKVYNVTVKVISNSNGNEDYFTAKYTSDGTITLTPQSKATNPQADVASTLVITAKDCWGHSNVYTLPFTVKRAK